ncbi:hypothetical protein KC332_g3174 [Hortaea werneckii]|nr:hypothetical protein KC329_g3671 [Hortaea werneckii]KAI7276371.1 hypothetical protein KC335_g767 [Hortaea werneckii]KAI7416074.1 hypothetical protein KC332_g3174 [Hortaea werneckii]KAI7425116.1 hypothetical protein KC336_g6862 [Hortaea werneckii]KAI7453106.1 hypothetical protein KC368_g2670 [Hortaea werneckii]
MRFDSEDLEIYLKPHRHSSEPTRLCEKHGIHPRDTFKTAGVYTQWKTDSLFDIVIRFGPNFKLGSANIIQIDVRAGKGQTNHCFENTAVFGIQTSWVKGQQHVLSSFTAKAYDEACCPELQADRAGKPIALYDTPEDVLEGSSEKKWAFLIRPMQDEQVWGKAGKRKSFEGKSFDRQTTPGNITVYVTRGTVTWDQPNEDDHNPAEKRVYSLKNMDNFRALSGQEGDPYIAEFRPLAFSSRPTFWLETYQGGAPKMPHKYEHGFIVQRDTAFNEARERTHDIRQRKSSEWKTRRAVALQCLQRDGVRTRSSLGAGRLATQATISQGNTTGGTIAVASSKGHRSAAEPSTMQLDDHNGSPQTEGLPEVTFCDCPKDHTPKQGKKSGMIRSRPRPANRSEGRDISSQTSKADLLDRCKSCRACGNPKVALKDRNDYKRQIQRDHTLRRGDRSQTGTPDRKQLPSAPTTVQHSRKPEATESSARRSRGIFARFANERDSSSDEGTSPVIPQHQQSAEASSMHDDGATPNLDDLLGTQANEAPSAGGSGGRIGDDDEDSPIQLARNSSVQFTRDSTFQSAEDSHIQVEEEESLSRVSEGNNILNQEDPQPMDESAYGHLMQRAATADMGNGASDANHQIGLGTHPTQVGNPHEAGISSQQTHLPLERESNEAMRTCAGSSTQKGQDTQDYSEGALQQQRYPTINQHNANTDGQHEQMYSHSSIDQGQARRLEQYATPAPSDGHQHRSDSVAPDQRAMTNMPAPSVVSTTSTKKRSAPQGDVVDLTNSDDDSPPSANNRPANQIAIDSFEKEREIEKRRATIQRTIKRRMIEDRRLEIEAEVLDLQDEDEQLQAGQVVKVERESGIKSEE